MDAIRAELFDILQAGRPMTVRQVFYAATTRGAIAKTEAEYKGTVVRLLGEMRRDGTIPYQWLADATRWMRKPTTYSSAESALRRTAQTYRRALWDDATDVVEVWLEKEALAGVLVGVTDEWDVPLMVTRGYPSMSFLHSAADAITDRGVKRGADRAAKTIIYYFGDRDPSGVDIDRFIKHGIGEAIWSMIDPEDHESTPEDEFAFWAGFERVAVTPEQITDWRLPTRPTKSTDTRSKTFEGASVELDAVPVEQLRTLARSHIEQHVDAHQLDVLRSVEQDEREVLTRMADAFSDGNPDLGDGGP